MDDGFQSARIHMDYALLVVDGRRGIGNGHVIPGGPMRAPLVHQMRFAKACSRWGRARRPTTSSAWRRAPDARSSRRTPRSATPQQFAGRRFLAFAGIGDPGKFFDTVTQAGGTVAMARSFADHHFFTRDDLDDLADGRCGQGLELITTAKDAVRLRHGAAHEREFAAGLSVLEIEIVFDLSRTARTIVDATLEEWRHRRDRAMTGSAKTVQP